MEEKQLGKLWIFTVKVYRCSQLGGTCPTALTTQLVHVKAVLEIKYVVRRAKKLL